MIESVPPLLILEPDLRVRKANESFYEAFGVTAGADRGAADLRTGQRAVGYSGAAQVAGRDSAAEKVFKTLRSDPRF